MKNRLIFPVFSVYLFLTLAALSLVAEEEEPKKWAPLADTDGLPSTIIDNCVSAITGNYIDSAIDLEVTGPELLEFSRFYTSGYCTTSALHRGWMHNHESYASTYHEPVLLGMHAHLREPSGRYSVYYTEDYNMGDSSVYGLLLSKNRGLTNVGYGKISAQTNLKNTYLEGDEKRRTILATSGDNTQRFYKALKNSKGEQTFPSLQWEKKPNGRQLIYEYDKNCDLTKVRLTNSKGTKDFGSIDFSGLNEKLDKQNPTMEVKASNGQKVIYKLWKSDYTTKWSERGRKSRYFITEAKRSNGPTIKYDYMFCTAEERDPEYPWAAQIAARVLPDNRYKLINYYLPGYNYIAGEEIKVKDISDFRFYRVKSLAAPVGHDEKPIVTHSFLYRKKPKKTGLDPDAAVDKKQKSEDFLDEYTVVLDAYNHRTTYGYSKHQKLHRLCKFTGTGPYLRYSKEHFVWGNYGTLLCKTIEDGRGIPQAARSFEYDARGNILKEYYYGNLTGKSKPLKLDSSGLPIDNGCDCAVKKFTYIKDPRNLIKSETETNGKKTVYDYVKGTNLVSAKLILNDEMIIQRHFFEYDEDSCLTKEIHDDGSNEHPKDLTGVTERHITYYYYTQSAPSGLVEKIEEKALDLKTGKEIALKTVRQRYNSFGQMIAQKHYDASGAFCFELAWDYDVHGNVILHKDALGQTTKKRYDANDNLIFEQGPSSYYHLYAYDFSNRLIRSEQVQNNGIRLVTTFKYDLLGNCIASSDYSGNTTEYVYDEFNRCIATKYPAIPNEKGVLVSYESKNRYDIFGNCILHIDNKGNKSATTYTILGKPIIITNPDGTQEKNNYNLDGTLRKTVGKNGSVTRYSYDVLGRVLETKIYSESNDLLSKTSSNYNGFHQTSFTDAEGITTYYSYDFAGRLICEEKQSKKEPLSMTC